MDMVSIRISFIAGGTVIAKHQKTKEMTIFEDHSTEIVFVNCATNTALLCYKYKFILK